MPGKKAALNRHRGGGKKRDSMIVHSNQPDLSTKGLNRERTAEEKESRKAYFANLVRVGTNSKPLLGKRTTNKRHHSEVSAEFLDFVTDAPVGHGKYRVVSHNPLATILLWRTFFGGMEQFWPITEFPFIMFKAAALLIKKYFVTPEFNIQKPGVTLFMIRQRSRDFLSSLAWCRHVISVFGIALLAQHTITIGDKVVPIHRVPRNAIKSSMIAFLNGSNGEFTGLDDVEQRAHSSIDDLDAYVSRLTTRVVSEQVILSRILRLNENIQLTASCFGVFSLFIFLLLPLSLFNNHCLDIIIQGMNSTMTLDLWLALSKQVAALFINEMFYDIPLLLFNSFNDISALVNHLFGVVSDFENTRVYRKLSRLIPSMMELQYDPDEIHGVFKLLTNYISNDPEVDHLVGGMDGGVVNPLHAGLPPAGLGPVGRPAAVVAAAPPAAAPAQAGRGRGRAGIGGRGGNRDQGARRNQPQFHPNVAGILLRMANDFANNGGVVPPVPAVQNAAPVLPDWNNRWDRIKDEFIHVDELLHKTTWYRHELDACDTQVIDDIVVSRYDEGILVNCLGSPFCGLTAIDVACKLKPKVDVYLKLAKYRLLEDVGRVEYIKQWAAFRGVNLALMIPIRDRVVPIHSYTEVDPAFEWVRLVLKRSDGTMMTEDDLNNPRFIGHFFLSCRVVGDVSNIRLPSIGSGLFSRQMKLVKSLPVIALFSCVCLSLLAVMMYFVIIGDTEWLSLVFSIAAVIGGGGSFLLFLMIYQAEWCVNYSLDSDIITEGELLGYFRNNDNRDKRSLRDRRDKFEHHDYYYRAVRIFSLRFLNWEIWRGYGKVCTISVGRANQAIKDAQLTPSPDMYKCLASVMRSSIANTDDSINGLYLDTIQYVQDWVDCCEARDGLAYDERYVAFNSQGITSFIPKLPMVVGNQFDGLVGGDQVNHVVRINKPTDKDFVKKVVAYSPFGCLQTSNGPLGPGNLCVTDFFSTIGAFVGRSMTASVNNSNPLLEEFVVFSKAFLDQYIDNTDVGGIEEEVDPVNYFKEAYKGKKTQSYIESVSSTYNDYISGRRVPKKFNHFGCFVKFEDSTKVDNGEARVRPRLIMTMSDKFLIETCQFLKVVGAWCHGPFSKFQVKNLEPEEFISMIQQASDKEHIVTDYSSFEASITGVVRRVENYVFERLMKRAGLFETQRKWSSVMNDRNMRVLKSKVGTFKIDSRCSGDFHTSAGNGIVNVCLNAFSCYKRYGFLPDYFNMIAEGDDGLISPKLVDISVINNLGFKFSSELTGFVSGDVDFLRRRWMMNTCFLNIGRSLKSMFWVKSQVVIGFDKQRAILRAMGMSLHYMSPGHPVLFEVVNRIGRLTSDISVAFKGIERYFDAYKLPHDFNIFDFGSYPRDVACNEMMRPFIADGAKGFPSIPISIQLELEKRIRCDRVVNIGSLLDDYDDIIAADLAYQWLSPDGEIISTEMSQVLTILEESGAGCCSNLYSL